MNGVINFKEKFDKFSETWTPKILGQYELFIVVAGQLTIMMRDREVLLQAGESFIVPKGVEHKPVANDEAHVLLVEKAGTLNTGDRRTDKTVVDEEWI
ncbi:Cupin domain protein [Candidatus Megaera venefica]|uniref:Cupin domain protein n=1 Tax=Candidatus Megaera venefica TaxID=2055910 RepID=A0ABU5NDN3_9RICK|nr:cupin domain-containing protein [Candidatus Megaera venefica]MEA0971255.1 Cupin domain protein [Candidatus Megaera venefica]